MSVYEIITTLFFSALPPFNHLDLRLLPTLERDVSPSTAPAERVDS